MSAATRQTEERELLDILLPQLDRFAAEKIDSLEIDRTGVIPPEVISGLGKLGLFSLSIPARYGGAGLSLEAVCTAVSRLAVHDRSVATMVGLHLGLGTRGLIAYGTEELRQELLPRMASGEWVASFAATEANAGSDLTAIATVGTSGDETLVLNGSKAYVTNSGFSQVLTLLVATPGLGGTQRGHSLVALRRSDPGVSFGPEEHKLGLRGSSTRPLFLEDVALPLSRIIGTPGQGMDLVYEVLAWGRTAMAAGCVGAATAAMNAAAAYVTERKQFGKCLAELPVVRQQVATMSAVLYAMRAMVTRVARMEDDQQALSAYSTCAKIFCSEGSWEVTDTALQLHGGSGFLEDTGLPLLLRDARITRIFEGANDVLRIHAGGLEAATPLPREALVATAPDDPLALAGDALAEEVQGWADELKRSHKIRLLRNHRLLHAIGSAIVLRDATDAAVLAALESGDVLDRAHAEQWIDIAWRRLRTVLEPLPDQDRIDTILSFYT